MFLKTSEDIVDTHPELSEAVHLIDGVLEDTSTESLLIPRQLAKFKGIDENRVESALDLFVERQVLTARIGVECVRCGCFNANQQMQCTKCEQALRPDNKATAYHYRAMRPLTPAPPQPIIHQSTSNSMAIATNELTDREKQVSERLLWDCFIGDGLNGFKTFLANASAKVTRYLGRLTGDNFEQTLTFFRERANQDRVLHLVFQDLAKVESKENWKAHAARLSTHFANKYGMYNKAFDLTLASVSNIDFQDFSFDQPSLEAATSYNPYFDIEALTAWLDQVKGIVCKVKCGDKEEGTGFLIDSDKILTCYHVVYSDLNKTHRGEITVCFDHYVAKGGSAPSSPIWLKVDPEWKIPSSPYNHSEDVLKTDGDPDTSCLDYAVLKLLKLEQPDEKNRKPFPLNQTFVPPMTGSPILIAGHPGPHQLQPMKFSMAAPGFDKLTIQKTRMVYKTSTERGSSGSPVFDHNFNLIGLHHNRGEIDQTQSNRHKNNRGIPIHLIAESLNAGVKKKTAKEEQLDKMHEYSNQNAIWLSSPEVLRSRMQRLELGKESVYPREILHLQPEKPVSFKTGDDTRDPDKVLPLIQLLAEGRERNRRLILLCGKCGSGKTHMLWRFFTSEQPNISKVRLFLDFEKKDLESIARNPLVDRVTGKWIVGAQSNLDKAHKAVASHLGNLHSINSSEAFLIVDGLDNAARFVATELEVEPDDKASTHLTYLKETIDGLLGATELEKFTIIVSLDMLPDNGEFDDWQPLFECYRDSCIIAVLDLLKDNDNRYVKKQIGPYLPLAIYRDAHDLAARNSKPLEFSSSNDTRSELLAKSRHAKNADGDWQHILTIVAKQVSDFSKLLTAKKTGKELEQFRRILATEWTGSWFDLFNAL